MKNSMVEDGIAYGSTSDFSVFAVSTHSVSFSDIDKHWGQENIKFLAARNIVIGLLMIFLLQISRLVELNSLKF
jgi:hypothetical protein